MNTEKLILRFREDYKELERKASGQLGPQNTEFFKTLGKMELLESFINEISNGEWDEEE